MNLLLEVPTGRHFDRRAIIINQNSCFLTKISHSAGSIQDDKLDFLLE